VKKTYISTSIAYINAEPHIGFLLELLSADVLARYHKLQSEEVFFLTGTDEHGTKIAQAAENAGQEPQKYADETSKKFEKLGKDFGIEFDYFIRTTDPKHKKFVQERWKQLEKAGHLEKRQYQGLYCVGCEAFKNEREVIDGKCAIHEKELEKVTEENWFFKLSDFKEEILGWLEKDKPVKPESRLNEIINVVKELEDISFSRPKDKLSWGVPVPGDEGQTMYVWADALWNYLSALELAGKKVDDFWPADIQIIGKDILKFHAAIWPGLLLACGYPLPKQILVHGFINVDGKKMSKSLGNVVTPNQLLERYGAEATRYLLFRQLSYYEDSNFTWSDFDAIYNGELANGLGNLVNRSVNLLKNFRSNSIPTEHKDESSELDTADFAGDIRRANDLITGADQWISEVKPWEWTKDGGASKDRVDNFLEQVNLPKIATILEPFMPETAKEIRRQLKELDPKPLFPRLTEELRITN
jgi:methionyl-tRNA synthetase